MSNYTQYAEKIVSLVEDKLVAGAELPWVRPWVTAGHANPASVVQYNSKNKTYTGSNQWVLTLVAYVRGWESPFWTTMKQAKAAGAWLKENERATPIIFWNQFKTTKKLADGTEEETWKTVSKVYYVYNHEQFTPETRDKLADVVDAYRAKLGAVGGGEHPQADQILADMVEKPVIQYGGARAAYSPKKDIIYMPPRADFASTEGFYTTLFHEIAHWTGAANRLGRDLSMALEGYSFEELVAEMTAAMIAGILGYQDQIVQNSAAYVRGWLKPLKENPTWLTKALTQALYAVTYIVEGKRPAHLEEDDES